MGANPLRGVLAAAAAGAGAGAGGAAGIHGCATWPPPMTTRAGGAGAAVAGAGAGADGGAVRRGGVNASLDGVEPDAGVAQRGVELGVEAILLVERGVGGGALRVAGVERPRERAHLAADLRDERRRGAVGRQSLGVADEPLERRRHRQRPRHRRR